MLGILIDQEIFEGLIKVHLPQISRKFQVIGLPTQLLSCEWFVCLFSRTFTPEVLPHVWDRYFTEGSVVQFKVGLAILSILEKKILECEDDFGTLYKLIELETKAITDIKLLISTIDSIYIDEFLLRLLRNIYSKSISK